MHYPFLKQNWRSGSPMMVPRGSPAQAFYAHTDPKSNDASKWEPLFTPECAALKGDSCSLCESLDREHGHLNKVAWWTAKFAEEMFPHGSGEAKSAHQWGYLAGLWHDLGKFAPQWQSYLAKKADAHSDEVGGKMDHSTAGAIHARSLSPYGALMAYAIAGHHAGLADGVKLRERLQKQVLIAEARAAAASVGLPLDVLIPAPILQKQVDPGAGAFGLSFFARLIFSCLVDADFLATESFVDPDRASHRPRWGADSLSRMDVALTEALKTTERKAPDTLVNRQRRLVREACEKAAGWRPGFFSLTVPTGGGKTLSSLAFALRHAQDHGLRQVIYVIPYTSIIEQNAAEFRRVFEPVSNGFQADVILEHHSNLDPARETTHNRLLAENWHSPLVVTTNVQFFESLFAARTSRCRKLHRLARAVIIFDEVQALPVSLLAPCLAAMKSLVRQVGSTLVLCTATQPALLRRPGFEIGLDPGEIREIIPDPRALFQSLRRTHVTPLGRLSDEALVEHFKKQNSPSALFIVNLRRHARELFEQLKHHSGAVHLSAQMCPEHRSEVLAEIRERLRNRQPVVLVATRLIEAGVDVSFPLLYRAEGGLDSLAQAAGRCNRNGELRDKSGEPILGNVFSFHAADHPIPAVLKEMQEAAAAAGQLEKRHRDDLLGMEAIEDFFGLHYWQRKAGTNGWDQPLGAHPSILSQFTLGISQQELFFGLNFATVAEAFHIIDSPMKPVVIPWREKGEALWKRLNSCEIGGRNPTREDFRAAQRLTVQISISAWQKLHDEGQLRLFAEGALPMLINERLYDRCFGLNTESSCFNGVV